MKQRGKSLFAFLSRFDFQIVIDIDKCITDSCLLNLKTNNHFCGLSILLLDTGETIPCTSHDLYSMTFTVLRAYWLQGAKAKEEGDTYTKSEETVPATSY